MENVICNIFEIGTLKNLHLDTNVSVLTEAFVNVWKKFVLADVILLNDGYEGRPRSNTKYFNNLESAVHIPIV